MISSDLIKKVRKIEIRSHRLSHHLFSGQYHSAFKGRGMAFSEVRQYQFGDDVRTIDWNVTARLGQPYVKVFEEERELTVMLLVDVSGSTQFGTRSRFKSELIAELCAVLAFSAVQNNDRVGLVMFSDRIEKYIPPKKGVKHILNIIHVLLNHETQSTRTDLRVCFRFLSDIIKKHSIAFILSDFIDENFEKDLYILARKHDVVAMQINDNMESNLPNAGLIRAYDSETGQEIWIDSSNPDARTAYKFIMLARNKRLKEIFTKCGIDSIKLHTDQQYYAPLARFLRMREQKRNIIRA